MSLGQLKQTISLRPAVHSHHQQWEWDFGDGVTRLGPEPGRTASDGEHSYRAPGRYTCIAVSRTADGQSSPGGSGRLRSTQDEPVFRWPFHATTVGSPEVEAVLSRSPAWVTGRPAECRLAYQLPAGAGETIHAELASGTNPGRVTDRRCSMRPCPCPWGDLASPGRLESRSGRPTA